MEKEKLSEQLKEGLGQTSLSDRTIKAYAEKIALQSIPENTEDLPSFLSPHIEFLKTVEGQVSFEVASKVKSTEKSVEKPTTTTTATKSDMDDDKLNEIESQIAYLKQFAEDFKAEKQQKLEQERKETLLKVAIKEARLQGVTDQAILDLVVPVVSVDVSADSAVADVVANLKRRYDTAYSTLKGAGYSPAGSSPTGREVNNFKAYKEQKQREGKLPKDETQTK